MTQIDWHRHYRSLQRMVKDIAQAIWRFVCWGMRAAFNFLINKETWTIFGRGVAAVFNSLPHISAIVASGAFLVVAIMACVDARLPATIIAPINIPAGVDMPFESYSGANLLRDEFISFDHEIIDQFAAEVEKNTTKPLSRDKNISTFNIHITSTVVVEAAGESPVQDKEVKKHPSRHLDVRRQFQVSVSGTSYESIVSFIRKKIGREKELRPDVIVQNGQLMLIVYQDGQESLKSGFFPLNYAGMKSATREIALKYFERADPPAYAEHLIANSKFLDAYQYLIVKRGHFPEFEDEIAEDIQIAACVQSNRLFLDGRKGDALHILAETREKIPAAPMLMMQQSILQMNMGNVTAAVSTLSEMQRYSAPAEYWNQLGILLARNGLYEKAAAFFYKAIEKTPASAYYFNLGNTYFEWRQFDKAEGLYRKAMKLQPEAPENHVALAKTLKAVGKLDAAIAEYDKGLELDPLNADTYFNRGNALLSIGKSSAALSDYLSAIKQSPAMSMALNNAGALLLQMGRDSEGEGYFQRAAKADQNNMTAQLNWGGVLLRRFRFEEAERCFKHVLAVEPKNPEAKYGLASSVVARTPDKATEYFDEAIHLAGEPSIVAAKAYQDLGMMAAKSRNFELAVDHFRRSIKNAPDSSPIAQDARENLASSLLGTNTKESIEEALPLLQNAIRLHSNRAPIHYANLISAYTATGRYGEAFEWSKKAVAAFPNLEVVQFNLGLMYYERKYWKETEMCFQKVIELGNLNPLSHYYLAIAAKNLNEDEKAKQEINRALQMNPKLPIPAEFSEH